MNSNKLHYSNFSNFQSHLYEFNIAKKNTSISPEVKNASITSLRNTFVRWCTELVLKNEFHEFEKTFNEWVKYDVEIVNNLTIVDLFWGIIKPEQATSSSEIAQDSTMQIDDNMGELNSQSDVEMAERSRITGLLWGSIKSEQATSSSEIAQDSTMQIDDNKGVLNPQSDVEMADHSKTTTSPSESPYFTMETKGYDAAFFEKFLTANATNRSTIFKMRGPFISWCTQQLIKDQNEEMNNMLDIWSKYDPSIERDPQMQRMWGM